MKPPYETLSFDWLINPHVEATKLRPEDGDIERLIYPFADKNNEGSFQKIELALGMSLFRGAYRSKPGNMQLIPLATVKANFPEPTFMVQSMHYGRVFHREMHPKIELLYSPGIDLFRLTDQLNLVPLLDSSQDSEMTSLTVGQSSLGALIGSEQAERLLVLLGLTSIPSVKVLPIPRHVSSHLHNAIPKHLAGNARALHCQARMLDYLSALLDHFFGTNDSPKKASSSKERSQAVYEFLIQNHGSIPTLELLAERFGRSARVLNREFAAEFGQPIVAFMSAYRLDAAHEAILKTNVPLKTLAERLGYNQVNNFNAAFKKKFGYPPGSLRRNRA